MMFKAIFIITILISNLTSNIASADASKCTPLFVTNEFVLNNHSLLNMSKEWNPQSLVKLTQKLDEIRQHKTTTLPWINNISGQKSSSPISYAATVKISKIIKLVNEGNFESGTYRLFNVKIPNMIGTKNFPIALPDSPLAPALAHIFLRAYSATAIDVYIKDLLTHTFQVMQNSDSSRVRSMAHRGIIDHGTIVEVLKARVKARGLKTVDISYTDVLPDLIFRWYLKRGIPIGAGFQKKQDSTAAEHGAYTRLIQFDMVSDIIENYSKELKVSPQVFFDFFSSKQGSAFWHAAFDGSGATVHSEGFTNPFHVSKAALYMKLRTPKEEEYYRENRYYNQLYNLDLLDK